MAHLLTRFVREDDGQDLIEYAFLALFLIVATLATLQGLGSQVNTQFSNISTYVGGS